MASSDAAQPRVFPTEEADRCRKIFRNDYEEKLHLIWVLNKVVEVLSGDGATLKYNLLKKTLKESKQYAHWQLLENIEAIQCELGFESVSNPMEGDEATGRMIEAVERKICQEQGEADQLFEELKDESLETRGPQHSCSLCAKGFTPEKKLQTDHLDLRKKSVIINGIKYRDFLGSVTERLQEMFPTLKTDLHCCPGVMAGKGNRGSLHGKRSEKQGIRKVAQSFIDFANSSDSMKVSVILMMYKFDDYLKYVNGVIVTEQQGDFDILMFSRKMGIFCVEVKATASHCNVLNKVAQASQQLKKCRIVLREMLRDRLDLIDLPVYEVVALPFVSKRNDILKNLSSCPLYSNVLTKEDLENKDSFNCWLERAHNGAINLRESDWIMSEGQYLTLLDRFVGFGSNTDIVPHTKLVSDIGDKCFDIHLTDKQWRFVNTETASYLTIAGDYGTGKSLILVKRAINCARELINQKKKGLVYLVACSDICIDGEYLNRQFPEHKVHHLQKLCKEHHEGIIRVETFGGFTEANSSCLSDGKGIELLKGAISNKLSHGLGELHLLFDEVPAKFLQQLKAFITTFLKCEPSIKTVWFVIAPHSYLVWHDRSMIKMSVKDYVPDCKFECLDEVLRSPTKVFKLSQKISECCADDHQSILNNEWEGSQPLLFRVPPCVCPKSTSSSREVGHTTSDRPDTVAGADFSFKPDRFVEGFRCPSNYNITPQGVGISGGDTNVARDFQVQSNPLRCECMEKRLLCTLKAIFNEIGIFKDEKIVEEVDKWPGKVTLLVFGVEDNTLFSDLHTLLIKCCKNIQGLYFRDTIMGESRQWDCSKRAGQGNQAASVGGCCGKHFDSNNSLNRDDINSQSNPTVVVMGCDGTSLSKREDVNGSQVFQDENQPRSRSSSGEMLDAFSRAMFRSVSSDASCSSEEGLPSSEFSQGINQAVGGVDCAHPSVSGIKEGEHKCNRKKRNVPEVLNYNENTVEVDCGSGRPEILLTTATHFVGCESHVVICIDLNAMKHWFKNTKVAYSTLAVSRCLSQYVHLTWQDEEAEVMYKMNVEACMEDLDSNDKRNVEDAKKESTLENLLEEGVITKQKVEDVNIKL